MSLPQEEKRSHILTLSFKDLLHSILSKNSKKEAYVFVTYTWLIWYAQIILRYGEECLTKSIIKFQPLNITEEFLNLSHNLAKANNISASTPLIQKQAPLEYEIPKVNTDVTLSSVKINIGLLVRNHLGIPLLAKVMPRIGNFQIDYREFSGVIEEYIVESTSVRNQLIGSDSLITIKSLSD